MGETIIDQLTALKVENLKLLKQIRAAVREIDQQSNIDIVETLHTHLLKMVERSYELEGQLFMAEAEVKSMLHPEEIPGY